MRWIIRITFILSLIINGYFINDEIKYARIQEYVQVNNKSIAGELTATSWKEGLQIFSTKLKQKDTTLLAKKYYYINVWSSFCKPCLKEIPWLDSIAGKLNKDVGYFFVTELTDEAANKCIKRLNYNTQNFVYLNDMNNFISAICNEKGVSAKIYPMTIILSNKGELLYSANGAYVSAGDAAQGFTELIGRLH